MSNTRTKLAKAIRKLNHETKELSQTIEKQEHETRELTKKAERLIKQIIG